MRSRADRRTPASGTGPAPVREAPAPVARPAGGNLYARAQRLGHRLESLKLQREPAAPDRGPLPAGPGAALAKAAPELKARSRDAGLRSPAPAGGGRGLAAALRPHGASGSAVQRLVGFEIEATNVPVSQPGGGGADNVIKLLAQGVQFAPLGQGSPLWERETDHGLISRLITKERAKWDNAATANKAQLAANNRAAVIEYKTVPFDENRLNAYKPGLVMRGLGYKTIYGRNDAKTVMKEIGNEIENYRLSYGAGNLQGYQVGIPGQGDFTAAAMHFGIPNAVTFALDSYDRLNKQLRKPKTYVQATIGILPEKIDQFLNLTKNRNTQKGAPTGLSAQDPRLNKKNLKVVGHAMDRVDQDMPGIVQSLTARGGPLPTTTAGERAALSGYLKLVLHVTLGSVAWHQIQAAGQAGVAKNMISFLPKTSLDLIPTAMPYAVRTDLLAKRKPGDFDRVVGVMLTAHQRIGAYLQTIDPTITDAQVRGSVPNVLTKPVRKYMREVLSGKGDVFFTSQAAGRPALKPEAPARGGRQGIATGYWDPREEWYTRAIAVETRHYSKLVNTTGLGAYADDMIKLAQDANA